MRRLLAMLLLAPPAPAGALTPEEVACIAERNRAVAALQQKWSNEAHDRAIASLTPKLQRIVGPPPKGTAGETYIIPDTLCCGVELGKLDAVVAVAHLALGSQAGPPQDLGVIVRKGERVFLTFRKVATVPALQTCEDGLAREMKPADAARTAGKVDESFRLEAEASTAYVRCWRTRAARRRRIPPSCGRPRNSPTPSPTRRSRGRSRASPSRSPTCPSPSCWPCRSRWRPSGSGRR